VLSSILRRFRLLSRLAGNSSSDPHRNYLLGTPFFNADSDINPGDAFLLVGIFVILYPPARTLYCPNYQTPCLPAIPISMPYLQITYITIQAKRKKSS